MGNREFLRSSELAVLRSGRHKQKQQSLLNKPRKTRRTEKFKDTHKVSETKKNNGSLKLPCGRAGSGQRQGLWER